MAKTGGLGGQLWVDGIAVGTGVQAFQAASPIAQIDVTDITQGAHERLNGIRDGQLSVTAYLDPAGIHVPLKGLSTADSIVTAAPVAPALGSPVACLVAKRTDYAPSRAQDGAVTFSVPHTANGFPLEWQVLATAGARTDTTATAGASINDTAASTFGAQAYLQLTAFTGTSITVSIQDSSTGSSGWADVPGLVFSAASAVGAQRVATTAAQAVKQYVRVNTSGTFTSATFVVSYARNLVARAI